MLNSLFSLMAAETSPKVDQKSYPRKAFLTHLAIFAIAFVIVLFVPVFYDGKIDFSFENRGAMLYGFIGWGVGLVIHGLVVLASAILDRPKK